MLKKHYTFTNRKTNHQSLNSCLTPLQPFTIDSTLPSRGKNSISQGKGSRITFEFVAIVSILTSSPVNASLLGLMLKPQQTAPAARNSSSSASCCPRQTRRPQPKVCIALPSRRLGWRLRGAKYVGQEGESQRSGRNDSGSGKFLGSRLRFLRLLSIFCPRCESPRRGGQEANSPFTGHDDGVFLDRDASILYLLLASMRHTY